MNILYTIYVCLPALAALSSAAMLALGIPAWRRANYVHRLEGQIPQLLRILADSAATGVGLRWGLEVAVGMGLRPAGDLAARALALGGMGVPLEDALLRVARTVPSASFKRLAAIVAEGYRAGGRLPEALEAAMAAFVNAVEFRRSLRSQTRPYVALIYAALTVFVLLGDVLAYVLLPAVATAPGLSMAPPVGRQEALAALYLTALSQSAISGLMVGRISYASPRAGLVHGGAASALAALGLLAPSWLGY